MKDTLGPGYYIECGDPVKWVKSNSTSEIYTDGMTYELLKKLMYQRRRLCALNPDTPNRVDVIDTVERFNYFKNLGSVFYEVQADKMLKVCSEMYYPDIFG